jgi:hypothetical protein
LDELDDKKKNRPVSAVSKLTLKQNEEAHCEYNLLQMSGRRKREEFLAISKEDVRTQISAISNDISNIHHQLNRLVSSGMSHFTPLLMNNGDGSTNQFFLCNGFTHLVLSVPVE